MCDSRPSGDHGPRALAEIDETVAWLEQALPRLPLEQREVLLLGSVAGLRLQDIATVLDIPLEHGQDPHPARPHEPRESAGGTYVGYHGRCIVNRCTSVQERLADEGVALMDRDAAIREHVAGCGDCGALSKPWSSRWTQVCPGFPDQCRATAGPAAHRTAKPSPVKPKTCRPGTPGRADPGAQKAGGGSCRRGRSWPPASR